MKTIINRELEIWQTAYPKEAEVLEKFTNKLYFELKFNFIERKEFLKVKRRLLQVLE